MNLSNHNWKRLGVGAVVVGTGAALTYLSEYVYGAKFHCPWLDADVTPVVVAMWTVVVDYVYKVGQKLGVV